MDFPTGKRTFMELRPRSDVERRSGHDRRKRSDPHYRGPERRSGLDRRAASLGTRRAYGEPLAAWTDAPAARAHRLVPAKGHHFLRALLVVMRIASEFACAEADEAAGLGHVLEMMRQLEPKNGHHRDSFLAERLAHLDKVKDRAVYVCFGDDPGGNAGYLCTVVIPGEPLIFEYESAAHERAVRPLLRRCAQVFGYEIVNGVAEDPGRNVLLCPEQRQVSSLV